VLTPPSQTTVYLTFQSAYHLHDTIKKARGGATQDSSITLDVVRLDQLCVGAPAEMLREWGKERFARIAREVSECGDWEVTLGEYEKLAVYIAPLTIFRASCLPVGHRTF
jgi:hypothetical protein